MAFPSKACPECGEAFPVNVLRQHRRREHDVPMNTAKASGDETHEVRQDSEPKQKKSARPSAGAMTVEAQLRLIYDLAGTLTMSKTPAVGRALKANAGACAHADEQLLRRWPKLYAAMEKGLIAGDILAVFMAHYPILMGVREEIEERRRMAAIFEGEVPGGYQEPSAA